MSTVIDTLDKFIKVSGLHITEGYSALSELETQFLKQIVNQSQIKTVLEIGFNAGHSTDIMLRANPSIEKIVSVDIGHHAYTSRCKYYIDSMFPGKHTLIIGDSRHAIPTLKKHFNINFDLIFIDGGHHGDIPEKDITNCKQFAHKDTIVVMDDYKPDKKLSFTVNPTEAWDEAVKTGVIAQQGILDCGPAHGVAYGKYVI